MSILSQILADKRLEVEIASRRISHLEIQSIARDSAPALEFLAVLEASEAPALIAEVKKASPSKGVIREDFDPLEIARIYAGHGAACLSVLTDEPYFQGSLEYLKTIRRDISVPLLRKDFVVDTYQIYESRAAGADAILLIVAALELSELKDMLDLTHSLGMAALVEVHNEDEIELAAKAGAGLIGVNNRDLHTFRTTLQCTLDLLKFMPDGAMVVSESGINHRADVVRLAEAGVNAILVGEALMREADIGAKIDSLLGKSVS